MSTSIACSKLRGYNETGLGCGITGPPMAKTVVRSSLGTSSEYASAAACSAFCYDIHEDVRIVAVVVPVRELSQVQRQVFFAHIVKRAHHATLQQAPEDVQIACMDIAAHIFSLGMIDGLMRKFTFQFGISHVLIGGYERHAFTHRLPNKVAQRLGIRVFDDLTDTLPLRAIAPMTPTFPPLIPAKCVRLLRWRFLSLPPM